MIEKIDSDLLYDNVPIKVRSQSSMVNISDLWKADGKPSSYRPDKWFKSESVQEDLEEYAQMFSDAISRDSKGNIDGIPGVLEILRGGRYRQGTYVKYDLALEYVQFLSSDIASWFTTKFFGSETDGDTVEAEFLEDSGSELLFDSKGFYNEVRVTPDGRVSVYDSIGFVTGHKNPWQVWNDLISRIPVFLQKTEEYKFLGKGGAARPTPVATLEVFLEILTTLPGKVATMVREKAVRTLVRVMKGDISLVDEILNRVTNPQDLIDIEKSINTRIQTAFGSSIPIGTMKNPIKKITKDLKASFVWQNRIGEMTDLLVKLATYMGSMIIDREVPHRPYSDSCKDKSRRIPLVLRTLENLNILHLYNFHPDYIDDKDVVDAFQGKAYPEIVYRDKPKGVDYIVAHLVAPAGITQSGVDRLKENQAILDSKYNGAIKLDAMRLDELIWGEIYPRIEERYKDSSGTFGVHHLNRNVKNICKKLCKQNSSKLLNSFNSSKSEVPKQLTFDDIAI